MMIKRLIKDFDCEQLLNQLRSFTYTKKVGGETVTVNVELFSSSQVPYATRLFLQSQGERCADQILNDYDKGDITATQLADLIKSVCVPRWKQLYEIWTADYNPTYNVEGTEKRVVTTEYGKVTTMAKDTSITDEQITNATDEITYGKSTTHTNPTTTGKVAAFDSQTFVNASETSMTNNVDTDSGKDETKSSIGKVEHVHSGEDTDTLSGEDTVTDIYTRGGNLGVTMTSQLLRDGENFWDKYSFFEHYFNDIAREIGLPIWG